MPTAWRARPSRRAGGLWEALHHLSAGPRGRAGRRVLGIETSPRQTCHGPFPGNSRWHATATTASSNTSTATPETTRRTARCCWPGAPRRPTRRRSAHRSEEHTSELQSLMRISYAVFCLKKNKKEQKHQTSANLTITKTLE